MGGQVATPGKQSGQPQVANADPAHNTQTVGKSTMVDSMYGNAGVESGGQGRCSNERGLGCFLNLAQRTEANSQVRAQLNLVATNYATAVEQCRVEELIKKVDELPWYASLLLGAAITVLESLVPMTVAAFRTASVVSQTLVKVGAKAALSDAEKEFKTLTAAQLSAAIKASTTLGKTNAIKSFTAAGSDQTDQANAKSQALKYTNLLNANAMIMWVQLIGDVGTVDDTAVIAMLKALDPRVLSVPKFAGEVASELARYAASNVSKIGRHSAYENGKHVEKEVRVARIVPAFGGGPYLVYMDRVFDGWYRDIVMRNEKTPERSGAYDSEQNALSLNQEANWKVDGKDKRGKEAPLRPDAILNRVEPEFEELAKAKQKDAWLNDVETFQISWVNGQEKVIKVAGS